MPTPTTLYEFYTSQALSLPSVSDRAPLYEALGLGNASSYTGTADQNAMLLAELLGDAVPQSFELQEALASLEPYASVLQAYTIGDFLAAESDLLDYLSDDFQVWLDDVNFRSYPSSMSFYDVMYDIMENSYGTGSVSWEQMDYSDAGYDTPSDLQWTSNDDSSIAGSFNSPAYTFDNQTEDWSLAGLDVSALSNIPDALGTLILERGSIVLNKLFQKILLMFLLKTL